MSRLTRKVEILSKMAETLSKRAARTSVEVIFLASKAVITIPKWLMRSRRRESINGCINLNQRVTAAVSSIRLWSLSILYKRMTSMMISIAINESFNK